MEMTKHATSDEQLTRDNARLITYSDDGELAIIEVNVKKEVRTVSASLWREVSGDTGPDRPDPYPVPVDAIIAYRDRIVTAALALYEKYYDRLADTTNHLALYSCLKYDGIACFDDVVELTTARQDKVRIAEFRNALWVHGAKPYYLREPAGGSNGYSIYNEGMARLGAGQAKSPYTQAAMNSAYLSAYSAPWSVNDKRWNDSWQFWIRERALSVYAHIKVLAVPSQDIELRDKYLEAAVRDHILGTHFRDWLAVDPDDWQTVVDCRDWAPFFQSLSAHALIACVESGLAARWGLVDEINTALIELAELCWLIAWRETDTKQGFFYRPTPEHDEGPAPDLNMLAFSWFAYCASVAKDDYRFHARAEKILRGSRGAWLAGLKQFNQSVIRSKKGFRLLGWENDLVPPESVVL